MNGVANRRTRKTLVIILTWNKTATTLRCATSVNEADGDHDIVIIDNGSRAEIKTELLCLLRNKFPELVEVDLKNLGKAGDCMVNSRPIWFLSLKDNLGFAGGNNVGIRLAINLGYQYSLISNNDIFVSDRSVIISLEKILDVFPDIAWTSPVVVNISGKLDGPAPRSELRELFYSRGILYPLWFMFFRSRDLNSLDKKRKQFAVGDAEPYIFSGSFGLFRNSALKEVSYFDENTFLYSEEEIIRERLSRRGYGIKYAAQVKVIHEHYYTKDKLNQKLEFLFLKSRLYYFKKYRGYSRLVLVFAAISGFFWVLLYYPIIFLGKRSIRYLAKTWTNRE